MALVAGGSSIQLWNFRLLVFIIWNVTNFIHLYKMISLLNKYQDNYPYIIEMERGGERVDYA